MFPSGFTPGEKNLATIMRSKSTRRVLNEILERHQATNGEVSLATGLAKSTVSKHANILPNLGLIRRGIYPDGRTKYEMAESPLSALLHRANLGLKSTVERYVDLWDF